MPFKFSAGFAIAGVVCAALPIIIHLLNRRRFRTVQWAAMDFLKEAIQRNRRIMQMRDLILLALRTAAVLLFGMALAQPYWSQQKEAAFDRSVPLHAIVIVDNSLSMGYESLSGTLLDAAKETAGDYIKDLPAGSDITVIPLCGSSQDHNKSMEPFATTKNAIAALKNIQVVDRSGTVLDAANLSREATKRSELSERVVLLSDHQMGNWKESASTEGLKALPAMQVVHIAPPKDTNNTWISDFRVQDGIADVNSDATFLVELQHQGGDRQQRVQVSLSVGDKEQVVDTKEITLEPGSAPREVVLRHRFNSKVVEAGKTEFVTAKASVSSEGDTDRLAADNHRYLAVPIVSALPVLFIDQMGDEEDASRKQFGDTHNLRKWLVLGAEREDKNLQPIKVHKAKIEDVDQQMLEDKRLVVIAGVADPAIAGEAVVRNLRDYVKQGGQLVIAAGANFDSQKWTAAAWLDGAGILPLPLSPEMKGKTAAELGPDGELDLFYLSYDSMRNHGYFKFAGNADADLAKIYAQAWFFKTAIVDDDQENTDVLLQAELQRLEKEYSFIENARTNSEAFAKAEVDNNLTETQREEHAADQQQLASYRPNWLTWAAASLPEREEVQLPADKDARQRKLSELARETLPVVIARFDNDHPYLVERRIGRGRVVFSASGVLKSWNTLTQTDAIVLYDRIFRSMLQSTLPARNFISQDNITLPISSGELATSFDLTRPGSDAPEALEAGYIGPRQRGLTINNPSQRGIYTITAHNPDLSSDEDVNKSRTWAVLAVNGMPGSEGVSSESELTSFTQEEFEEVASESQVSWVNAGETISLAGSQTFGQTSWWYLALAVFIFLLVELIILAWPKMTETNNAASSAT